MILSRLKKRSAEILRQVAGASVVLLCWVWPCVAQDQTETHRVPPTLTPPPTRPVAPPSVHAAPLVFKISGYDVQGNTLIAADTLRKLLAEFTGEAVGMERIRQALAALQMAYRGRGFATVAVTLPPQQLADGIVRVQVTEGRLAEVKVVGNRYFSSESIMRQLPNLRTNQVLNSRVFQADLDRANENRDRQIYPMLGPGPDPGTSALTLKVKDRLPLHGRFEVNNQSPPGTPDLRMNAALQYNNLWGREQQAGLQYSFSPEAMKEADRLPRFFDQPLVASYSAFYRIPFSLGDPVKAAQEYQGQNFGYKEVTHKFRPPPALHQSETIVYASRSDSDSGVRLGPEQVLTPKPFKTALQDSGQDLTVNENAGFRLRLPVKEFWKIRSSVSAGLDYKGYRLESLNTNFAIVELITINNSVETTNRTTQVLATHQTGLEVRYLPVTVGWDAYRPDPYGHTTFNLSQSFHMGGPLDGNAEFARAAYTTNASSSYYVLNASAAREQKLYRNWTAIIKAQGQYAPVALLSNEQFALGGVSGVRGYRDGEEYGDAGWSVGFEPRTPVTNIGLVDGTLPMVLRGSVFTDYGQRYLLESSPGRAGALSMWGTGVGVSATIGQTFELRCHFAWALLDTPGASAGAGRVYFGAAAQF